MRTGAVVTAANITERDENINAFDDIAVMSAPERIVATLKKCGIDDIIVVTGYDAKLRKKMRHFGLSFAENKGYDVTDVLQSAKLGLEKIYRRCDRVLFCPSGYPFSAMIQSGRLSHLKAMQLSLHTAEKKAIRY